MSTRIYAASIEHNTLNDADAPVTDLQVMAKFDDGDGLYATPVSGDALTRLKKLGRATAKAQLLGWRTL